MDNNSNIAPKWAGFRKLWIIVAIILFLLLLLLLLAGYSPWGTKCEVAPTVVEKIVEKEVIVDNPDLLTRIGILEKENALIAGLEKENAQIAGLKTNVADLSKLAGLVTGLQAKVKTLEAVDLNFENPTLLNKIKLLETENASIADMKKRIIELESTNAKTNDDRNSALTAKIAELETENGLIAGLKAKVAALEAIDVNFIKPQDNTELLQKINNLEVKNMKIPTLESRIQSLQSEKPVLTKQIDELEKKNGELATENGLIAGLQAKVKALEAVDVNFIKPEDNTELLKKINNLEVKTKTIPTLESRIQTLQSEKPVLTKQIDELEKKNGELATENGLIAGLQAKVKALEAIDVNFIKPQDNTELLQKINNLEVKTMKIPTLESRIQTLQSEKPMLTKKIGELEKKNAELETENGLIAGLQAKVKALEAIDINFKSANKSSPMMALPEVANLYFDAGSSRSPRDASLSMAEVIVYLRANPESKVSLAGFHDATGNANWNRRLATRRSNRVKQLLTDAGIKNNRINVETPTQTLGTGSPEQARRVEVRVSK